MNRGWLVLVAIVASPAWAAPAEGSFERTLTVTGPVDLDVRTGAGGIQVRAGSGGSVRVYGKIRARNGRRFSEREAEEKVRRLESNPPIEQNGNVIRIGHIEDRELREDVSISYELSVPAETRLRSHTGSGSQTVDGVRGPVDAATGSGTLTISNIGDRLTASTGSGGIDLSSIKGRVQASTGSGSIRAHDIAGAFTATTGSGGVRLAQSAPGGVEVSTGSGSIELTGVRGSARARSGSGSVTIDGEPTGEWNLDVASGSLTVRVPPQAGFDLQARTGSGRISIDHPLTVRGMLTPKRLEGRVRGGGPLLALSTASGNIRIE